MNKVPLSQNLEHEGKYYRYHIRDQGRASRNLGFHDLKLSSFLELAYMGVQLEVVLDRDFDKFHFQL